MTSRAECQVAAPGWGALEEHRAVAPRRARAAPGPARPASRGETRGANRETPVLFQLGGRRRLPSEIVAAAVLAAVWIALWALFTAGVVGGAAGFRDAAERPRRAAEAAEVASATR